MAALPAGHADFYVAAAAAFPVLALALVLQTRFGEFFASTWLAYVFGLLVFVPLVAGWAAAIAALEGGRDTGAGRAVVCAGLGAVGFILLTPMLISRFLRGPQETQLNFGASLLLALLLLAVAALVGLWAIGAV